MPVLMDVDTGVDDCIALLYAVASPNVELVAATCCAGNVVAPRAAANTLAVLELAGAGACREPASRSHHRIWNAKGGAETRPLCTRRNASRRLDRP